MVPICYKRGDIIERGLFNWGPNGPGGCLVALAWIVCDSLGELETVIDNSNKYTSDSITTTYISHRQVSYTVSGLGDGGQLLGYTW